MSDFTMEDYFANTRQPKMVTITVKGEPEDLQNWFQRLNRYLSNQASSVDFDIRTGSVEFRVHPFAIND